MGYLLVARHEGEKIILRAEPGTDARDLLNDLLFDGIAIEVVETTRNGTWLGFTLPEGVTVQSAARS